jgi:hypothetical protein
MHSSFLLGTESVKAFTLMLLTQKLMVKVTTELDIKLMTAFITPKGFIQLSRIQSWLDF